jgi:EmrB/QacA subfamily drug resistance transporter
MVAEVLSDSTDGSRTDTAESITADRDRVKYAWRVLSVTSVGMNLAFLNTSTLTIALPVVARHFDASEFQASWFILAYLLVNTSLILVFGRTADLIGRRQLYLFGLSLITVASLASAFAPDAYTLIALRGLQGVGGAAILANTTALLVDAFPPRLLPLGLGFNVTAASAASVLGPVVGGFLVTSLGWRAVFWFNVPIGVIGVYWAMRTLRDTKPVPRLDGHRERFDRTGGGLTVLILTTSILWLSKGNEWGWASPLSLGLLSVATVSTGALVLVERASANPLIDPVLFRDRARSMAYAATTVMSLTQSAIVLLVALYLQAVQGLSPLHSALLVIAMAGGIVVASPLAGRLSQLLEPRLLASAGFTLSAIGLFALSLAIHTETSHVALVITLAVIGFGCGIFQSPNTTALMSTVPSHRRGIAGGVRSMVQGAGQAIGTALGLALVTSALEPALRRRVYSGTALADPAESSLLVQGFRTTFLVLALISLIGIAASLLRGSGRSIMPTPVQVEGE